MSSLLWRSRLLFLTNEIAQFWKILEEPNFDWTIEKQLIFFLSLSSRACRSDTMKAQISSDSRCSDRDV